MWILLTLACTFVTDEEWAARIPDCEIEGFFLDLDGDTYGNQPARTCEEAAGGVARSGDCNDADGAVNPGVDEVYYDDVDGNCDGLDDNDADGDGYPSADHGGTDCYDAATDAVPILAGDCGVPTYTPDPEAVHPGADDTPYDAVDSDCSGGSDYDADRDGYSTCIGDCDDGDPERFPDASVEEVWYDEVDQNCDNNDGDQDGDGYYVAGYTGEIPEFFLAGDCDDLDDEVYPGATEVWYDGGDADCAGDDDWDQDGDGYRSASEPDLDGLFGDDCDDTDATLNPGIPEDCFTAADDNCDGDDNDVDATGCVVWYRDGDLDGRGDAADSRCACVGAGEYTSSDTTDCDDGDASVGTYTWYYDGDGDGAGTSASAEACDAPVGYAATNDDCDDADGTRYPAAIEACDDADSDCDGDKNDPDALASCVNTWYVDNDGDGYAGDDGACLCAAESPYVYTTAEDCDDADALVSPAAAEVCNDALDNDCDGGAGACNTGTHDLGSESYAIFRGGTDDYVGYGLAFADDTDGDGDHGLWIGGYDSSLFGTGRGYALFVEDLAGSLSLTSVYTDYFVRSQDSAATGCDIASGGDFDGDGVEDVIIGAFADTPVSRPAGSATVLSGATGAALGVYYGDSDNDWTGMGVAFVPDLSGDGLDEVMVASPGTTGTNGRVSLILGGTASGSALDSSIYYAYFAGEAAGDYLGGNQVTRDLSAGDVNGDGTADLYMAASMNDANAGALYGYYGPPPSGSQSVASADLIVRGSAGSGLGHGVRVVPDLNDDGYDDLAVGATAADQAYLLFGGTGATGTMAASAADVVLTGPATSGFGYETAGADLVGDGVGDLMVSAPWDDTNASDAGAVYSWSGPLVAGALSYSAADLVLLGDDPADHMGLTLELGDYDGDGDPDVATGANEYSTGYDGAIYIWATEGW